MDREFRGADERRAAIVALTQQETGIDEAMIETLVRAFYARVRQDPLLRPFSTRAFPTGSRISTTCSHSGRR
jgi:truncated hemoglobin YjbI